MKTHKQFETKIENIIRSECEAWHALENLSAEAVEPEIRDSLTNAAGHACFSLFFLREVQDVFGSRRNQPPYHQLCEHHPMVAAGKRVPTTVPARVRG